MLFESQLSRLSTTLRDLRAIDRQREAELRALRERVAIADAKAQAVFAARMKPALAQIDAMLGQVSVLLQAPLEPPPSATHFERMRARRSTATLTAAQRETLLSWAGLLADLRVHLAALVEE
jgi:predicted RecB family endonuclease